MTEISREDIEIIKSSIINNGRLRDDEIDRLCTVLEDRLNQVDVASTGWKVVAEEMYKGLKSNQIALYNVLATLGNYNIELNDITKDYVRIAEEKSDQAISKYEQAIKGEK